MRTRSLVERIKTRDLQARPGTRRSILLTGPHAGRDDGATSLYSFVKWTHRSVKNPPRVVLLSGGENQYEFAQLGVKVIDHPTPSPLRSAERSLRRLGYPRLAKMVLRLLHAWIFLQPTQPRCVYASTVHGAGPALRHLPPGAQLVVHAYETGDLLDQFVDHEMMQRLAGGVSMWVAASEAIADDLAERGVDPDRITRCNPFIDPPSADAMKVHQALGSLGLGPDEVVVGGIGHSDWRDAPDLFLRVASMFRRRHPELPVRFVWVGAPEDGPTRWILDHDIRHAGLTDTVTLVGKLEDSDIWLSTFDVLCLTARVDPPPPTALQAGALGVPMVGFGQSGLLELAEEPGGADGVRCVPYLDIEAMCGALVELVVDDEVRKSAGAEFRQLVLASHMTEEGAKELWALLERTANGGTPPMPRRPRRLVPEGSGAVETAKELVGASVKLAKRLRR